MPNARKKSKAMIGGYVPRSLADQFKRVAKDRDLTAKDLLEQIIIDFVKSQKKEENHNEQ